VHAAQPTPTVTAPDSPGTGSPSGPATPRSQENGVSAAPVHAAAVGFHPAPVAAAAPTSPTASAKYRSDPDPVNVTRRRWWKDTLYTKSGRRDADMQKQNQGQAPV
jgi:hypothetical protein